MTARAELVGYWGFDDLNLAETSGFRPAGTHDGRALGTVRYSEDVPPGRTGFSLDLPNVEGSLGFQVANSSDRDGGYQDTFDAHLWKAGQFTFAVWVKSENMTFQPTKENQANAVVYNGILTKFMSPKVVGPTGSTDAGRGYVLRRYQLSNKVVFSICDGGSAVELKPGEVVFDGKWRHLAVTHDGNVSRLYLDGKEVASTTQQLSRVEPSTSAPLLVGLAMDARRPFRGKLDDVRCYNTALSASEIAALATGQATTGP